MKDEIDLIKVIRINKKIVWACISIFIIVLIAGFFLIRLIPIEKNYISSSKLKVINGEKSLNLYLGTYHRITTTADVVSVLRSHEVLSEVAGIYNINMPLEDLRQNIDLYEIGDMIFRLELIYPDQLLGEKINLSLIHIYLDVIESRMDNDNKEIFDVEITGEPVSREMESRNTYKMIAVFIFGLFCVIIIILITELIRTVSRKRR